MAAFVKELKRTLRKDITKRMCETYAFYLYDKWWSEQEEKYKSKVIQLIKSKLDNLNASLPFQMQRQASKSTSASKPKVDSVLTVKSESIGKTEIKSEEDKSVATKAQDLTSIFDKQREKLESGNTNTIGGAFGMGGSLGFGFRGTIPKLPSFKVRNTL